MYYYIPIWGGTRQIPLFEEGLDKYVCPTYPNGHKNTLKSTWTKRSCLYVMGSFSSFFIVPLLSSYFNTFLPFCICLTLMSKCRRRPPQRRLLTVLSFASPRNTYPLLRCPKWKLSNHPPITQRQCFLMI